MDYNAQVHINIYLMSVVTCTLVGLGYSSLAECIVKHIRNYDTPLPV